MKEPIHSKPTINVRIAPELYEVYTKIAKKQGRSVTAQINFTLRRTMPIELARLNPSTVAELRAAAKEHEAKLLEEL